MRNTVLINLTKVHCWLMLFTIATAAATGNWLFIAQVAIVTLGAISCVWWVRLMIRLYYSRLTLAQVLRPLQRRQRGSGRKVKPWPRSEAYYRVDGRDDWDLITGIGKTHRVVNGLPRLREFERKITKPCTSGRGCSDASLK